MHAAIKDTNEQVSALSSAVAKLEGSGPSKGDGKHPAGEEHAKGLEESIGDVGEHEDMSKEPPEPSSPPSSPDDSPRGYPCHRRRGRRTPFQEEEEEDRLPTRVLKLDFPLFDGTSDPLAWLNHYDIYLRG